MVRAHGHVVHQIHTAFRNRDWNLRRLNLGWLNRATRRIFQLPSPIPFVGWPLVLPLHVFTGKSPQHFLVLTILENKTNRQNHYDGLWVLKGQTRACQILPFSLPAFFFHSLQASSLFFTPNNISAGVDVTSACVSFFVCPVLYLNYDTIEYRSLVTLCTIFAAITSNSSLVSSLYWYVIETTLQEILFSFLNRLSELMPVHNVSGCTASTEGNRAVYTRENKPRITQSTAYVSRKLLV